jgi:hypothetical protein
MKRSFLVALKELFSRGSKKPWACFETTGPDETGKLGFSISWNSAFTENLQKLGMAGQTDEETVQLFFLQLRMIPDALVPKEDETDVVNPEATPNLTSEANQFVRG